jgi:hypothetical protein
MSLLLSGTNGLSDVDGSAATPAIRGTDANTGIFFPAADTIAFAEGGAEVMRIDSNGNVGIGTASPATKLQVNGKVTATGIATAANTALTVEVNAGTAFNTGGAAIALRGSTVGYNDSGMEFYTGNNERARINSSGNLLVGTTSGSGRVNSTPNFGNIDSTNAISQMAFVATGGYGGGMSVIDGTQGYGLWAQNNGADFYIRRSSTSASFTGGVYISNAAGSWSSVSDERLKNILRPIENATEKLLTLRCIVGEYKDQVGSEHPFLIAQDVQAVFPEVVNTFGNEGHLGMSYTDMVPILVKAIQELKAIVDAQGAEIAALKGTQP